MKISNKAILNDVVFKAINLKAFALFLCVLSVACDRSSVAETNVAPSFAPLGSLGEIVTQTHEPQDLEANPLRATFALYPTELAFGDAVYYTLAVENVFDSAAYFDGDYTFSESALSQCVARVAATVDGVPGEYVAGPVGGVVGGLAGAVGGGALAQRGAKTVADFLRRTTERYC